MKLHEGAMKAPRGRYEGSTKALLRLYQGSIKDLLRLYLIFGCENDESGVFYTCSGSSRALLVFEALTSVCGLDT
jgi:hypothetical protein